MGGRNLRIRTQTLLDDELLLGFPPDSDCRALRCGLDAGKLRTLFDHPWKRPFLTISSSPAPGIWLLPWGSNRLCPCTDCQRLRTGQVNLREEKLP